MTRRTIVVLATVATTACNASAVLTQQVEARRLASQLQVQFSRTVDASNRAVMADTDDLSSVAVKEAEQATQRVLKDVDALRTVLTSMGYSEELGILDTFGGRFAEYRKLDAEILPLAVENTNVKAQRLSFGPAADAAGAFRTAVETAAAMAPRDAAARADALAARAAAAVLEIQVLQAPHIAEPEDAPMTRMEAQMAASEGKARKALAELKGLLTPESSPQLAAASAALDRFTTINHEIVTLSRRNSDVRSLALSLGRKRVITAQCDDQLRALQDVLAKHTVVPTR